MEIRRSSIFLRNAEGIFTGSIVLDIDCYCWLNLLLSPPAPATWLQEYKHLPEPEPAKIIVTTDDLNFTEDSEAAKVVLVTAKYAEIFNF